MMVEVCLLTLKFRMRLKNILMEMFRRRKAGSVGEVIKIILGARIKKKNENFFIDLILKCFEKSLGEGF